MTKHSKKDIVKSLQSRFPKLADRIERSAAAIEDAYKMVRKSTVESYKRDRKAITTLAQSGAIPGTVAKFFIGQLVDPEPTFVLARGGRTRAELSEEERETILKRDIKALRIARDTYFSDIDWNSLSDAEKMQKYRDLKEFLTNFPRHFRERDSKAEAIYLELGAENLLPEHALEGCGYMLTLGGRGKFVEGYKGKVSEVKMKKFGKRTSPPPGPGPGPGPQPPGPGPPTPPANYGSISGRVMDEATVYPDPAQPGGFRRGPTGEIIGNGIPGARVTLPNVPILDAQGQPTGRTRTMETYTDGYGRYRFDRIAPGHYTVFANTPVAPPAGGVPITVTPLGEASRKPYPAPVPRPFVEQQQPADVVPGQPSEVNFALTLRAGAIPLVGRPAGAALRAVRRHVTPSTTEVARIMGTKFINSAYRDVRKVLLGKGKEEYRKFTDDLQRRVANKGTEVENLYRAWQDSTRRVEQILRAAGQTETANEISTIAAGAAAVAAPEAAPFLALADRAGASTKGTRIEAGAIEAMKSAFDLFKDARKELEILRERPYEVFETKFKETLDKVADTEVTRAKRKWRLSSEDGEDLKKLVAEDMDNIVRYYTDAMERGATEYVARILSAIGYTTFSWGIAANGDKVRDTMGYFLKEWWGPIAWGVLYAAGLSPWNLLILIIWAFMKIPLFTGVAIAWLQIAFLVGGTVLGLMPLPGYIPATAPSNLILIAIVGGLGNWLMNMKTKVSAGPLFEGTPFGLMVQQLSHVVAGGIIVLGVEMLMMGLGFEIPPINAIIGFLGLVVMLQLLAGQAGMGIEWMPFIMILSAVGVGVGGAATGWFNGLDFALFLIFLMLGMTNFYPAGGIKTISVIAVGVLIFGYFAMGPYSAYVHEMTDQFKQPMRMAWGLMRESFTGIWLLLTNPTEYYARQQLVSVRTERPLSWPQGIEITSLTAVPEGTVPADQEFSVYVLAENKGDFTAENVRALAWCPLTTTAIGSVHCNEAWGRLTSDEAFASGILSFFGLGTAYMENVKSRIDYQRLENFDRVAIEALSNKINSTYNYPALQLRPSQAERWRFDFTAQGRPNVTAYDIASRAAETVFNKVVMYIEYTANTSTSLQVEVASSAEIDRRSLAGETPIYKPVPSISKVSPAQVSLNVGPQPLEANQPSKLILSISNARPDGSVILQQPAIITLNMSETVGRGMSCPDFTGADGTQIIKSNCIGGQSCRIEIYPDKGVTSRHVIRPYEFKDIFALSCNFTSALIEGSRTGLVTAKLTGYTFAQTQLKSITVGPELGIIASSSGMSGVPTGPTTMK